MYSLAVDAKNYQLCVERLSNSYPFSHLIMCGFMINLTGDYLRNNVILCLLLESSRWHYEPINVGRVCNIFNFSPFLVFFRSHYIPEKRKFSGILYFRQLRPPLRHNFVVSAITFEGFKLHSSNLTHALLIQIFWTSSIIDIVVPSIMAGGGHFVIKKFKKFCIDLKCPEMQSKVNFGHPNWPIDLKLPEMRSKVIFGHPK